MAAMAKIVFNFSLHYLELTVRFLWLNAKRFYEWTSPEAFYFSQV